MYTHEQTTTTLQQYKELKRAGYETLWSAEGRIHMGIGPKTKLDLYLDGVRDQSRELTLDFDGWTRADVDRVIARCEARGFSACFDGRFCLVRGVPFVVECAQ